VSGIEVRTSDNVHAGVHEERHPGISPGRESLLETEEGLSLSLEFIRARIEFGRRNVPNPQDATFVVHYDLRGQSVPADIETILRTALAGRCEVRVKS
jgi:hypothetical protein